MKEKRCEWAENDKLYMDYHDTEWGVPLHDDRKLFEFLILEGAQAGLSWITILRKRDNFRKAFDQFDPHKIILYDEKKINTLMNDAGIIRNRLKIHAAIKNASAFLDIVNMFGSFDAYIWQFTDGVPITNSWTHISEIPPETDVSVAMSKDLKKRGFTFVGPTICYAFMQAIGMVNDHVVTCFRYRELQT
ncbi:MAG: DNA-3-methyladenine glycosylase I [Proteobacteria bacterium]|nr:DNA-3-methyladenine glycosylase I [Pseudomonadota bacterium]